MSLELYAITIKNLSSRLRQQAESMTKNRRVNSKKCVAGGGGWQVDWATSLPRVSSLKSWSGQNFFPLERFFSCFLRDKCQKPACKSVTCERARRAVLQDEGLSQPTEGYYVAVASSVSYKAGAPGAQCDMVGTTEGEGEPRRDTGSQGGTSGAKKGHHNRCCSWWLHRNAPGLPRQQNGLATCLSLNIHPGWFVSPDTWHVPSVTIGGWAGDGTERASGWAQPDLSASPPPLPMPEQLWGEHSAQGDDRSSFPNQANLLVNQG